MYKRKLTNDELTAIQRGHAPTLKKVLEDVDQVLVRELKKQRGDVSWLQGASHIVDNLLDILK